MISVHAPGMARSEKKRDSFWKELKECKEASEDKDRVLVTGKWKVLRANLTRMNRGK